MILGGLADDLTGGLELAAMLVAEGVPTTDAGNTTTCSSTIVTVASGSARS